MLVSKGRADNSLAMSENSVWHNVGHFKHLRTLGFDLNLVFAFYYAAIDHSYIS